MSFDRFDCLTASQTGDESAPTDCFRLTTIDVKGLRRHGDIDFVCPHNVPHIQWAIDNIIAPICTASSTSMCVTCEPLMAMAKPKTFGLKNSFTWEHRYPDSQSEMAYR